MISEVISEPGSAPMDCAGRPPSRRRQRGTTLLEALVAFLVLSLGMLTVARVQTQLRLHSDVARQRSEAVRLAQEDIERLRAFSVVAASAGLTSYAQIAGAASTVGSGTHYALSRRIEPAAGANAKSAAVQVGWTDRQGGAQQVALDSIISGTDPAYSGALSIVASGLPARGAFGRSALIPLGARNLGNGSSAFKPVAGGSLALVFDNGLGRVSARCTGVAPSLPTRELTSADLIGCTAASGYLLSGTVRFASGSPADPADARAAPLAFGVAVALAGGANAAPAQCSSEALKTVSYPTEAGGTRLEAVPLSAEPAALGLTAWTDSGDRYAVYHCVVVPAAGGQWSGRSALVATSGWSVGSGPGEHRVCRYSADLDASGAVDANVEHPASYSGVQMSLANQNFLVIAGTDTCPGTGPLKAAGGGGATTVFADLGTTQHQP